MTWKNQFNSNHPQRKKSFNSSSSDDHNKYGEYSKTQSRGRYSNRFESSERPSWLRSEGSVANREDYSMGYEDRQGRIPSETRMGNSWAPTGASRADSYGTRRNNDRLNLDRRYSSPFDRNDYGRSSNYFDSNDSRYDHKFDNNDYRKDFQSDDAINEGWQKSLSRSHSRINSSWQDDSDLELELSPSLSTNSFVGKGPKGYRRSDDRIKEEVCEALERTPYLDASDIEVDVKDGCVTLSGTVSSRQYKRSAEYIIEKIRGVDDIDNEIKVKKDTETSFFSSDSSENIRSEKVSKNDRKDDKSDIFSTFKSDMKKEKNLNLTDRM